MNSYRLFIIYITWWLNESFNSLYNFTILYDD